MRVGVYSDIVPDYQLLALTNGEGSGGGGGGGGEVVQLVEGGIELIIGFMSMVNVPLLKSNMIYAGSNG